MSCTILIYAHHERILRADASSNSRMTKLNVQLQSLHSPHPMLKDITSARDVTKLKSQIKLVSGDFWTNDIIGERSKTSTACLICKAPVEDESHVFGINGCPGLNEPKPRILADIIQAAENCSPPLNICHEDNKKFIQFLADPSSFFLDHDSRVDANNSHDCLPIFKVCRDYVYAVATLRFRKIKELKLSSNLQNNPQDYDEWDMTDV